MQDLYGYDAAAQAAFAERAARRSDNAVTGTLAPLPPGTIAVLPARGTPEHDRLRARGEALIAAGQVGVVILAGGMATRFGGVVKAIVPAHGDRTFLQLKLADAAGRARALVMSSFATHDAIVAHVRGLEVDVFPQMTALRLTPDGAPFRDARGELSPYATGHGDLTFALRASGALRRFRDAGGTTLLMSNVDNLGATLDPAILGVHAEGGAAITAEVVRKAPGDKGGAPALLDGVPQII
jgi:UTP--glucose-1-phosphate uridylyltransferase